MTRRRSSSIRKASEPPSQRPRPGRVRCPTDARRANRAGRRSCVQARDRVVGRTDAGHVRPGRGPGPRLRPRLGPGSGSGSGSGLARPGPGSAPAPAQAPARPRLGSGLARPGPGSADMTTILGRALAGSVLPVRSAQAHLAARTMTTIRSTTGMVLGRTGARVATWTPRNGAHIGGRCHHGVASPVERLVSVSRGAGEPVSGRGPAPGRDIDPSDRRDTTVSPSQRDGGPMVGGRSSQAWNEAAPARPRIGGYDPGRLDRRPPRACRAHPHRPGPAKRVGYCWHRYPARQGWDPADAPSGLRVRPA